MKKTKFILLPISLLISIFSVSCSNETHSAKNPNDSVFHTDSVSKIAESEHVNNCSSFSEKSMTESEVPESESITTTSVSSQPDSSIAETTTTTTTTATTTAEDPLPQKPVIDESAISDAKAQLADNDIIARKDTVICSSNRKCVLYITSCGDCYTEYFERETISADDRFWMNDIAETPQTIDEIEGAEYLGTLADEEISELINFSLSVDSNAECYEDLRGEYEDAPDVYLPSYDIYTFMIWDESHERTIYTAFVWDSLDYFLNSSDECAYAAVMIINHGEIADKYYRYCDKKLDLY